MFSCPVVSNSLPPHGLQHTSPSPSPEVCPSSCPLHWWCHTSISSSVPLFSFCSQSFLASGTFPMSQLRIRWPKYWSFSISPFNVYSGLTSLKIDWFYFLAVQGIFRSLLQHHSSKGSILWCSAFFMVQLSHPYTTTGKTTALTIQTFVGKVMSLFFNTLSKFVIAFLLRSRCLLISWLPVTVCSNFGAKENKVCHCFHCFPIYLPWNGGTGCMILVFISSSQTVPWGVQVSRKVLIISSRK